MNLIEPHPPTPTHSLVSPEPQQATPKDELIEIYAPAGKLGIILETPGDGPPIVHQVRPNSVLRDEIQVGDRIIALDDEDVRNKSANKVSKMISRKMENTTRKFTVIRTQASDVCIMKE
jgi:C-terminal processing protease CtpA/Prc